MIIPNDDTNCYMAASHSRNSKNIRNPRIYYVIRYLLMFCGSQGQALVCASIPWLALCDPIFIV